MRVCCVGSITMSNSTEIEFPNLVNAVYYSMLVLAMQSQLEHFDYKFSIFEDSIKSITGSVSAKLVSGEKSRIRYQPMQY